jgi:hypothetical protein
MRKMPLYNYESSALLLRLAQSPYAGLARGVKGIALGLQTAGSPFRDEMTADPHFSFGLSLNHAFA